MAGFTNYGLPIMAVLTRLSGLPIMAVLTRLSGLPIMAVLTGFVRLAVISALRLVGINLLCSRQILN